MFADGKIWGWVVGLPYAALVALEVSGQEAWRVAATPYLDVAIVIGLAAIGWRMNGPPDPAAARRKARAARAAVEADPTAARLAREQGLLEHDPDDHADEAIVRRPRRQGVGGVIGRALITVGFVMFFFILLVAIGLGIVRWARAWWYVVVPAMALVGGLLAWWIRGMVREGEAITREQAAKGPTTKGQAANTRG